MNLPLTILQFPGSLPVTRIDNAIEEDYSFVLIFNGVHLAVPFSNVTCTHCTSNLCYEQRIPEQLTMGGACGYYC